MAENSRTLVNCLDCRLFQLVTSAGTQVASIVNLTIDPAGKSKLTRLFPNGPLSLLSTFIDSTVLLIVSASEVLWFTFLAVVADTEFIQQIVIS